MESTDTKTLSIVVLLIISVERLFSYPLSYLTLTIDFICDEDSFIEFNGDYTTIDVLEFEGYKEKIEKDKKDTGLNEAVITGTGMIKGINCVLIFMDNGFRMGSMGSIVGEKIYEATQMAISQKVPIVSFITSGGARMQEGVFSLMQMAKTVAAFDDVRKAGIMTINILANPTMGGVSASFANVGDVILAEPGANIGFAGKRVIAKTINAELPSDFQSAEFLEEHGHIDGIVSRERQSDCLYNLLRSGGRKEERGLDVDLENRITQKRKRYKAIEKLELVRNSKRPTTYDYVSQIFQSSFELHGDRFLEDDKSIIAGIGFIDEIKAVYVGQQHGKNLEENIYRNYGMNKPAGYRKVKRIVEMAGRLHLPIISFIDTKGADPTAESETQNQSFAIASCILAMMEVHVPIISIIIGEGGSGGALSIAIANKMLMLENSLFSVISPEGAASILWKDDQKIETAIENLKITAQDLKSMGIIDDIIPELDLENAENVCYQAQIIKKYITQCLAELFNINVKQLVTDRKNKYKRINPTI